MKQIGTTSDQASVTAGTMLARLRCRMTSRRSLMFLAITAIAGGAAANWGWLVAAGITPLILATLPCVAICALGLCANPSPKDDNKFL